MYMNMMNKQFNDSSSYLSLGMVPSVVDSRLFFNELDDE
jgi:hypothetical protein